MRSRGSTVTGMGRCVADVTQGGRRDAPALPAIAGAYWSAGKRERAGARLRCAIGCRDTALQDSIKSHSRTENSARPQRAAWVILTTARPTWFADFDSSEDHSIANNGKVEAMKRSSILLLASIALLTSLAAQAQVAGSTLVGVATAELRDVTVGWSAKRQVLGKAVFNDNKERIGKIDDIVIAPDKAVSYAIIGAGGFLGVAKHDVAIPVDEIKLVDGKFVLAGATREALKAMASFEYAR